MNRATTNTISRKSTLEKVKAIGLSAVPRLKSCVVKIPLNEKFA